MQALHNPDTQRSHLPAAQTCQPQTALLAREHGAALHAFLVLTELHPRPSAEVVEDRLLGLLAYVRDGIPVDISKVTYKAGREPKQPQYESHLKTAIGQLISWEGAHEYPTELREVLQAYMDAGFFGVNTFQAEILGMEDASVFEQALRCDNAAAVALFMEAGARMDLLPSPSLLEHIPRLGEHPRGDINAVLDVFSRLAPAAVGAARESLMRNILREGPSHGISEPNTSAAASRRAGLRSGM